LPPKAQTARRPVALQPGTVVSAQMLKVAQWLMQIAIARAHDRCALPEFR
jgi:hypothetical protein